MSLFKHCDLDKILANYLTVYDRSRLSRVNQYYYKLFRDELIHYYDFYNKLRNEYKSKIFDNSLLERNELIFNAAVYFNNYDVMLFAHDKYKPKLYRMHFETACSRKCTKIIEFIHKKGNILKTNFHKVSFNGFKYILKNFEIKGYKSFIEYALKNNKYKIIEYIKKSECNMFINRKVANINSIKIYKLIESLYYDAGGINHIIDACLFGDISYVRYLINYYDIQKRTIYAVLDKLYDNDEMYDANHYGIFECLLSLTKPIRINDIMGNALKFNNHDLVKWLLINRNIDLASGLLSVYVCEYGDMELIKKCMKRAVLPTRKIHSVKLCHGDEFKDAIDEEYAIEYFIEAAKKGNLDEIKYYVKNFEFDEFQQYKVFKEAVRNGHFLVARYLFATLPIDILYKHKAYAILPNMKNCDNNARIQMADWICSFDKRYDYRIINSHFEFAPITD